MEEKWDRDRLEQYIRDCVAESSTLEYKRAAALSKTDDKKRTELSKDISAMANSAGGILIYGIAEYSDDARKHLPEKLDGIDRTEFSREWLDQMISNIQPRIAGLKIHQVDLDLASNQSVYVVEIPQSTTAHQATDRRYYRRFNFTSEAMEDYEIRDVMNRAVKANAEVIFGYDREIISGELHKYTLKVTVRNLGYKVIEYFRLHFTFPNYGDFNKRLEERSHRYGDHFEFHIEQLGGVTVETDHRYGDITFTYRAQEKLFPEEQLDLTERFQLFYRIDDSAYKTLHSNAREWVLNWLLYADDMTPKSGKLPLSTLHTF